MELADKICAWMADVVALSGARGLVVGLSGGVDSAVVAGMAKRTCPDATLALIMPCESDPADEAAARLVANAFELEVERIDLSPVYQATLAVLPPGNALARANLKPRLRMVTLYHFASSRGYLVVGTGNKSEAFVGYSTKYGDGGVDLLPIGGLLKAQVWELARQIGVPPEVVSRPPSAGLWAGQTDEAEMGITYEQLDRAIRAIEAGDTTGIEPAVLERVQKMHAASAHKRALPPIFCG